MKSSILILVIMCAAHQVLMQQTMHQTGDQQNQGYGYPSHSEEPHPSQNQPGGGAGGERAEGGESGIQQTNSTGHHNQSESEETSDDSPSETTDDHHHSQNQTGEDGGHGNQTTPHDHTIDGQIGEEGGHGNQSTSHHHTSHVEIGEDGGHGNHSDPHPSQSEDREETSETDPHEHDHKPHQSHIPKTSHCRPKPCTKEYSPVCGKRRIGHCYEEKIFSNKCLMRAANACSKTRWVPCVPRKCRRHHHP